VLAEALERARTTFFLWADVIWMPFEHIGREEIVSRRHHIAIADAVAARDAHAAATAMRRHLTWSASTFTRRLSSNGQAAPSRLQVP
jgi:DNA-binding GntR family transcriptional regulator